MAVMLERLQATLRERYRVEREIGAGGMATVFLATDLKHHRAVAIKVLRPELAAAIGPERFLREIEIAAKLQHPHILPVYDSGDADGILYYVMPFVEGESLRDRLVRGGALQAAEAVRIAREVADALAYAHHEGIVHRDIKPANILLSQGHAVVADFGIARAVSVSATGQGLTQAGMAVGTPTYMSPEQALGDPNVDGRSDVYALGIVFYEMLVGNPPFVGSTPQAIVAQTLSRTIPKLTRDPLGLQSIIERALAREPKDRIGARELSAELEGQTSGARPVPRPRRPARIPLVAGGIVIAAIAAVALWPRGYRVTGDPRRSLIVFPFENRTGDASREYLSEAAMNLLGLAAAHWQDMRVYDDERTASLLRRRGDADRGLDFEDARGMAKEARVGTLVVGDLRREGDSLAIEAKVHDVGSGERLSTVIVRVPWGADARPAFDGLAAQILGTSGAPPGERPSVLAQTTTSIDAYRAYLAGSAALQRFQIDTAQRWLERAVALDSTFALAYIRLRDADGWAGLASRPERRASYILAAERHSASLPPRLKSLVQYHSAYMKSDFSRARAIASEMIARDSTDVEAWYQLGEAHYHHRSLDYPHPDSLGNLGLALQAFQRTLALDSTYILAYQHILDALGNCAGNPFRACTADSAVYGTPDELAHRLGSATVERLRADARAAAITTARGWVAAVPGTPRAREMLVAVLYQARRYDDALRETQGLEQLGAWAVAATLKGSLLFQMGRAGEASTAVDSGFRVVPDTLAAFIAGPQDWSRPTLLLAAAGGRWAAGIRMGQKVFESIPIDSPSAGGVRMGKADVLPYSRVFMAAELGQRRSLPGGPEDVAATMLATIERLGRGDSAKVRRVSQGLGATTVAVYLATRDTLLLTQLTRRADTANSLTWRVADALLALAQGDSARARLRVARHYQTPHANEFSGELGVVRAYAWGDVLTRLRQPREALAAYARMDSVEDRIAHPGLLVRSWAERGALHQQLGEVTQALGYYERFIAAWQHADPELQPAVEQARATVAALKGQPVRPPGDNP